MANIFCRFRDDLTDNRRIRRTRTMLEEEAERHRIRRIIEEEFIRRDRERDNLYRQQIHYWELSRHNFINYSLISPAHSAAPLPEINIPMPENKNNIKQAVSKPKEKKDKENNDRYKTLEL